MDEPVVYWRPQVGDHVRVKVNAECPYCTDPRFPASTDKAFRDDGRLGVVAEIGHEDCSCWLDVELDREHQAHDIWVKWEVRLPHDEPPVRIGDWECPFDTHFTAGELEPVEEPDAHP